MRRNVGLSLLAGLILFVTLLAGCLGGSPKPQIYSASGTVVDDEDLALDGVQIAVTGGKSAFAVTENGGEFAFTGLTGTCVLTPSLEGWDFEPEEIEVSQASTNLRFVGTPQVLQYYALTIENGTGGGEYSKGTDVTITADPPTEPGIVFDKWITSGAGSFADETFESTGFIMPGANVVVTATYREAAMEDYFQFDKATGTITAFHKTGRHSNLDEVLDPEIPSSIRGLPVEAIGESAFQHAQITSVVIPESVTAIEPWAFQNNLLETVTIPDSVTAIGEFAFCGNHLTTLGLPEGITQIPRSAFYLNKLTSVTIPDSVTHIGLSAFEENLLTNVDWPASLTHIGDSAFCDNSFTSLEIPSGVSHIGRGAFDSNQQLQSLVIPGDLFIDGHAFYQISQQIFTITIGSGVTLGENLLGEGDQFRDVYTGLGGGAGTYQYNWIDGIWNKE